MATKVSKSKGGVLFHNHSGDWGDWSHKPMQYERLTAWLGRQITLIDNGICSEITSRRGGVSFRLRVTVNHRTFHAGMYLTRQEASSAKRRCYSELLEYLRSQGGIVSNHEVFEYFADSIVRSVMASSSVSSVRKARRAKGCMTPTQLTRLYRAAELEENPPGSVYDRISDQYASMVASVEEDAIYQDSDLGTRVLRPSGWVNYGHEGTDDWVGVRPSSGSKKKWDDGDRMIPHRKFRRADYAWRFVSLHLHSHVSQMYDHFIPQGGVVLFHKDDFPIFNDEEVLFTLSGTPASQ